MRYGQNSKGRNAGVENAVVDSSGGKCSPPLLPIPAVSTPAFYIAAFQPPDYFYEQQA